MAAVSVCCADSSTQEQRVHRYVQFPLPPLFLVFFKGLEVAPVMLSQIFPSPSVVDGTRLVGAFACMAPIPAMALRYNRM